MTQLIINIEDKSILPHLKGILKALNGVSIVTPPKKTFAEKQLYKELHDSLREVKDSIEGKTMLQNAKDVQFL
ncbi:MAG: hypothetical protein K2N05_05400 [Muribaculaceae bacterium]|nr:hypothetical protein [Muribaculaceae bacterium]